jgi:acetyl-CoA acetyltransferase
MTGSPDVVVVGAAESERIGVVPDQSQFQLATDSVLRALAQCGLTPADVDGVATTLHVAQFAHHIGTRPRWLDGTGVGGCSYLLHVRHAVAAIQTGQASVVVVAHGESGRSRVQPTLRVPDMASPGGQFELVYGVAGTFSSFTIAASAYLHRYGLGEEALAEVPVAQSAWAVDNPRAFRRKPLTVEDVLASRMIAWPFRVLECCPLTDGGGALVLTSAERAADLDLSGPVVRVAGSAETTDGPGVSFMEDLTSFRGWRDTSREALAQADRVLADIDHLMVYDAYAHLPLYGLEDIGFVGRGEAPAFIASGATRPGGSLPMNTSGGGLLYTHTGQYGMFAILEAVRQLRGDAAVPVPGVRTSLVQGVGGMFNAAAALVLTTD